MTDIFATAVRQAATKLLTELLVNGVKAGSKFARREFAEFLDELESAAAAEPAREFTDTALRISAAQNSAPGVKSVQASKPLLDSDVFASLFLATLKQGEHRATCGMCASDLFDDLDRRSVLLDTLQATPPHAWTVISHERLGTVEKFDLDVWFQVNDAEPVVFYLLLTVRLVGGSWKVWSLEWTTQAVEV